MASLADGNRFFRPWCTISSTDTPKRGRHPSSINVLPTTFASVETTISPRNWRVCSSSLMTPGALRSGSKRRPMVTMYRIPTPKITTPVGAKSNIPKGRSPAAARASLASKFGGVPTNVTSPPSREPNESGINNLDAVA